MAMNNDLTMIIRYARVKFTRTDHQIADYLLSHSSPEKIEPLALHIGVSISSLTRFIKKLGFSSFKEFYYRYQQQLNGNQHDNSANQHDALHYEYVNLLQNIHEQLDVTVTEALAQGIAQRTGFHVFGAGFSTFAAEDLKLRFRRLGKFVEIITDIDSMKMYSPLLKADDLLIVLSLNGRSERLTHYLATLQERHVTIACISANKKSPLLALANHALITASLNGEEATGMITPQLPLLMAIDFLYYIYVSRYQDSINLWMQTEKDYLA
ncbi:MurR/RpiR family transcriptional regulator [Celerinatantimonas yamalensis]|uniref:MurR/RpiR family transcriptional regulator n=1 Tax=Celerinatantimonas yamalensis TaxID=559956 RepID=A0ABW9G4V7_9GAMM